MKQAPPMQKRRSKKSPASKLSPRAELLLERARAIDGTDIDRAVEAMNPILWEVITKIGSGKLTVREAQAINREAGRILKEMRAKLR